MKYSYECPICKDTVTLFVTPSEAPVCTNTRHKTRSKVMTLDPNKSTGKPEYNKKVKQ